MEDPPSQSHGRFLSWLFPEFEANKHKHFGVGSIRTWRHRRHRQEHEDERVLEDVDLITRQSTNNSLNSVTSRTTQELRRSSLETMATSQSSYRLVDDSPSFYTVVSRPDSLRGGLSRRKSWFLRLFKKEKPEKMGTFRLISVNPTEYYDERDIEEDPEGDPMPNFSFGHLYLSVTANEAGVASELPPELLQPAYLGLARGLGPGQALSSQWEALREALLPSGVWNLWVESATWRPKDGVEEGEYYVKWKAVRKIWRNKHIEKLDNEFDDFIHDQVGVRDHTLHLVRFGLKPKKDRVFQEGIRLIVHVPETAVKQLWTTTNDLLFHDRIAQCPLKGFIYGASWKKVKGDTPDSEGSFALYFWVYLREPSSAEIVSRIAWAVAGLYPESLSDLLSTVKVYENATKVLEVVTLT